MSIQIMSMEERCVKWSDATAVGQPDPSRHEVSRPKRIWKMRLHGRVYHFQVVVCEYTTADLERAKQVYQVQPARLNTRKRHGV